MAGLEKLKGITKKQIQTMRKAGVDGTERLLTWGSTPDGRMEIARATKISSRKIADWVHRADLMRVKGIDDDYARLLARAGVKSVVDLSTRNPVELAEEIEIAAAVEQVKRIPRRATASKWIEQARLTLRNVWYHDTWGDDERTGRHPPPYKGPRYE
jgi:hypothetical protein